MSSVSNVSDVTRVTINGKIYEFSAEQIKQYPRLLSPETRYIIGMESILPIIYGYKASCIHENLIDDPSEKALFLANTEKLDIKLSDDIILHLSSKLMKDIKECSDYVQKQAGTKGVKKMRFSLLKEVQEFAQENDKLFEDHQADIMPLDVIRMLELGTKKSLEALVLKDFKSNNLVKQFIDKFLKKFLP